MVVVHVRGVGHMTSLNRVSVTCGHSLMHDTTLLPSLLYTQFSTLKYSAV